MQHKHDFVWIPWPALLMMLSSELVSHSVLRLMTALFVVARRLLMSLQRQFDMPSRFCDDLTARTIHAKISQPLVASPILDIRLQIAEAMICASPFHRG
jgi:hypothetical protein